MRPTSLPLRLLAAAVSLAWLGVGGVGLALRRPSDGAALVSVLLRFLPAIVALVFLLRTPRLATRPRAATLAAWACLVTVLILLPLGARMVTDLLEPGRDLLLPSGQDTYALAVAIALTSLAAALVVAPAPGPTGSLPGLARVATLATSLTLVIVLVSVATGPATRAASTPAPSSVTGSPASAPAACTTRPVAAERVSVALDARLLLDDRESGRAHLEGIRTGGDERWQADWQGIFGSSATGYARFGDRSWLRAEDGRWELLAARTDTAAASPDRALLLALARRPASGESQSPQWAAESAHGLAANDLAIVAVDDLGVEVLDGVEVRHCRRVIDGPTALDAFRPLRWLIGQGALDGEPALEEWRGDLDWWLSRDSSVVLARASVGGLPPLGWPRWGLRGSLTAELRAAEAGGTQKVEPPR